MHVKEKRTDKEEVKEDRMPAKQREHQWVSRNQVLFEKVSTISPKFKRKEQNASEAHLHL